MYFILSLEIWSPFGTIAFFGARKFADDMSINEHDLVILVSCNRSHESQVCEGSASIVPYESQSPLARL